MPDILIRDVEMPVSCYHCFAVMEARNDYDEPTTYCTLTKPTSPAELHKVIDGINHQENRMWFCPLVELPAHGDLIDRDALPAGRVEWEDVDDAPVIVPASGEATND